MMQELISPFTYFAFHHFENIKLQDAISILPSHFATDCVTFLLIS